MAKLGRSGDTFFQNVVSCSAAPSLLKSPLSPTRFTSLHDMATTCFHQGPSAAGNSDITGQEARHPRRWKETRKAVGQWLQY